MDVFEKIYSNMENAAKQNGRWHALSIMFSFILLTVSIDIVSAKDEFSLLGINISLSKTHFLALLICSVLVTLSAGVATGLHEHRLRNILRKHKDKFLSGVDLSEEDWHDCVEVHSPLSLMLQQHVIGKYTWKNLPGVAVFILLAFSGVVLPFVAVGYGLFEIYENIGATWWVAILGLLSFFIMLFLIWRGLFVESHTS